MTGETVGRRFSRQSARQADCPIAFAEFGGDQPGEAFGVSLHHAEVASRFIKRKEACGIPRIVVGPQQMGSVDRSSQAAAFQDVGVGKCREVPKAWRPNQSRLVCRAIFSVRYLTG